MNLLFEDNYEERIEALILIKKMVRKIPQVKRDEYINKINNHVESLSEKLEFYSEAIDVIKQE